MRRRLQAESGFTIPELLISMIVLAIVAAGAMTMIQVVLRQSRGVVERSDAMQRGRLVLDQLTREVRSQVCLNASTYGLVAASPQSITFYTDFSDRNLPELHRLTYDGTAGTLTRTVWTVGASGPVGYPGSPARTTLVMNRVQQAKSGATVLPVFQYYRYDTSSPPIAQQPLTAAELAIDTERMRTAKIDIAFEALPAGAKDAKFGTTLIDSVLLRTADPNATKPDPTCR